MDTSVDGYVQWLSGRRRVVLSGRHLTVPTRGVVLFYPRSLVGTHSTPIYLWEWQSLIGLWPVSLNLIRVCTISKSLRWKRPTFYRVPGLRRDRVYVASVTPFQIKPVSEEYREGECMTGTVWVPRLPRTYRPQPSIFSSTTSSTGFHEWSFINRSDTHRVSSLVPANVYRDDEKVETSPENFTVPL